jgi:hypothetical protein
VKESIQLLQLSLARHDRRRRPLKIEYTVNVDGRPSGARRFDPLPGAIPVRRRLDLPYHHLRRRPAAREQAARLSKTNLVRRALHQHKLHFADVYRLRRDHAGRIFLQHDGFVFHEGE